MNFHFFSQKCFQIKIRTSYRCETACKPTFNWKQYLSFEIPGFHHYVHYMYITVPLTVTEAERQFSELKLTRNFVQCTDPKRFSCLALLFQKQQKSFCFISRTTQQNVDFNWIIDIFVNIKYGKNYFCK